MIFKRHLNRAEIDDITEKKLINLVIESIYNPQELNLPISYNFNDIINEISKRLDIPKEDVNSYIESHYKDIVKQKDKEFNIHGANLKSLNETQKYKKAMVKTDKIIEKGSSSIKDPLNKYLNNPESLTDGEKKYIQSIRYERNPKNRARALQYHNTTCKACGFNFNDYYGKDLAKDFIEVHHINPLSEGEIEIDPKKDLIPLCSNCHSMIHRELGLPTSFLEIENRYRKKD